MAVTQRPSVSSGGARLPRAWHVLLKNGRAETVTAHDARIFNSGVLAFLNFVAVGDEPILVRAFAATDWIDIQLIDTPHSPAVQLAALSAVY